jgi:hypothetical protein
VQQRKKEMAVLVLQQHAKINPTRVGSIKLADLRPLVCNSLVRIGSDHDGGYVVPLSAVREADALLSFGLCHNWAFERDFMRQNTNAAIHCYDHTVSLFTAVRHSIGQACRFMMHGRLAHLPKIFAWIDYLLFFRGRNVHFQNRIWRDCEHGNVTVDEAFERLPSDSRTVFLKMDIEGSEYRVLDDVLKHADDIVAMTIEFHEIDLLPDTFSSLIKEIKRKFHIVHIHGNNNEGVSSFDFPIVMEITFQNKKCFSATPLPSALTYPVSDLDRPNHPARLDYAFEFSTSRPEAAE